MSDPYELPELQDVIAVMVAYHQRYGKVPRDLIEHVQEELGRYPVRYALTFYSDLLMTHPQIAVFFCSDEEGSEGETEGPASLKDKEEHEPRFCQTVYHG